jgi:hypothetical protein
VSSQPNMPRPDEGRDEQQSTVLRGRWLIVARALWIAIAAFAASLCLTSIAVTYVAYPKICGHPNQASSYADVVPYSAYCVSLGLVEASNVQDIGLSLNSYTAYTIALDVVHMLGFWALAVLIFWKKSNDRMVLFVSLTLLLLGSSENSLVDTLFHNYPEWSLPVGIIDIIGWLLLYILFFVFPDGRFVPRWTRWFCATGILYFLFLIALFPEE